MSTSTIPSNLVKALTCRKVEGGKHNIMTYFALFVPYVLMRSATIILLRQKADDFDLPVEIKIAVCSAIMTLVADAVFSFLIKFLHNQKDKPFFEVMTMLIYGKIYAIPFIVLSYFLRSMVFVPAILYGIVKSVFLYNNLHPGYEGGIWLWIILIFGIIFFVGFDLHDFNSRIFPEFPTIYLTPNEVELYKRSMSNESQND